MRTVLVLCPVALPRAAGWAGASGTPEGDPASVNPKRCLGEGHIKREESNCLTPASEEARHGFLNFKVFYLNKCFYWCI